MEDALYQRFLKMILAKTRFSRIIKNHEIMMFDEFKCGNNVEIENGDGSILKCWHLLDAQLRVR